MIIQLNHVSKLYGDVIGANDLTIDLEPGAYGLVGPNGAGKTTLINLLTGQIRPTLGAVRVFDSDPWTRRSVLRRIGLCPATDVLYPNVSAIDWVTYQVRLHGLSVAESRDRAAQSLEMVSMTDNMHREMGTYSLGMRQRTKIAQAMAHQPELLILDEPYNGLDPVGRYQMSEVLKQWTEDGRSLVFASHVLHEIEAITSSFLLIHSGRLLASGTAGEIEAILAGRPQEVSIIGKDASKLIQRVAEQPWVNGLQLADDRTELRVAVQDPAKLYAALPRWIHEDGLVIDQFRSSESNLTAVFETLLRHHRGENV